MKTLSAKAKTSGLMKTFNWPLLLVCFSCSAQTDLRIVGTNLYDFTKAGPSFHLGGNSMQIIKTYPQSVKIEIKNVHTEFVPELPTYQSPFGASTFNFGSSSGFLDSYAKTRIVSEHKLSAGEAFSMGISGHDELFVTKTIIYLLHPPAGYNLDCYAIPTKSAGFWDCGEPFSGDQYGFKYIYRVLSDKIVCERQYSPKEILETEMRQASNNVAYFQYKLSQRYFKGDGVQTNRELSLFWANLAASNSYPDAVKFISQFTNIPNAMSK